MLLIEQPETIQPVQQWIELSIEKKQRKRKKVGYINFGVQPEKEITDYSLSREDKNWKRAS
jgi:hypothetical protein